MLHFLYGDKQGHHEPLALRHAELVSASLGTKAPRNDINNI